MPSKSVAHKIKHKQDCCGCNACAEICPEKCIDMTKDSFGFLYPVVDISNCINCGACVRVCPLEEDEIEISTPMVCYAARMRDTTNQVGSSSGGAATAISAKIIESGGAVYGCSSAGLEIEHTRIETLEGLQKLRGSKYVQSDTRKIYSQVKADLKNGREIAFVGTPCQTYGLKRYLRTEYTNLLLVDIICHGVPSQKMLREHIKEVTGVTTIDSISFRNGWEYCLKIKVSGKSIWSVYPYEESDKDLYFKAFIGGLTFRPSCYRCKFARSQRYSDITVGDFWGLKDETLFSGGDRNIGTSVILPSTEKGLQFVARLKDTMEIHEREVAEAVEGNTQLQHPVRQQKASKLFYMLYPTIPFDKALAISYKCGALLARAKRILRYVIN